MRLETSDRLTHAQIKELVGKREGRYYECPSCGQFKFTLFDKDDAACHGDPPCDKKKWGKALWDKKNKRVAARTKNDERKPTGLTIKQYAELKKLPVHFLSEVYGLYDEVYQGVPSVAFPYDNGTIKHRMGPTSRDFKWEYGVKPSPYGYKELERIANDYAERFKVEVGGVASGEALPLLFIVEGESDCQTMRYFGFPTLGISGAKCWLPEYAKLLWLMAAAYIFVVREPKKEGAKTDAGLEFVTKINQDFPPGKVRVLSLPHKDPSALWLAVNEPNTLREPDDDAARYKEFREAITEACLNSTTLEPISEAAEAKFKDTFAKTDTGNAERMVAWYGSEFRYATDVEKFRLWNGAVWEHGGASGDNLLGLSKKVLQHIADAEWREVSESAGKRRAMIAVAKGEDAVRVKSTVFDQRAMLLNVANGTIDLATQRFYDFRREDYLTKQAPVVYDAAAVCPKFDDFMDFIFDGDKDVIQYMLKALGYSLTANISEQVFHLCHGNGKNGKTTLLELVSLILGLDYTETLMYSTLCVSKYPAANSYDLATLHGARFVTSAEPSSGGGELDESILKRMTGGDEVKARQIYQEPIRFYPECKIWLLMNNKPPIRGTDEGIWRRVRFVPFNVQIPAERRVLDFHRVLFTEEGPGILNRLLEGVRDWLAEGLKPPTAIADATASYRETNDTFKGFLDQHTTTGNPELRESGSALYDRYRIWATANDLKAMNGNEFGDELGRRGFIKKTIHGRRVWYGIALKEG